MSGVPEGQTIERYKKLSPVERNIEFYKILQFIPKGHAKSKPMSREEFRAQWDALGDPTPEELEAIRKETPKERELNSRRLVFEALADANDTPFLDGKVLISEETKKQRLNSAVRPIVRTSLANLIALAVITDDLRTLIINRFDQQWITGERLLRNGRRTIVRGLPSELPIEVLGDDPGHPGLFDPTRARQFERMAYHFEQIKASPMRGMVQNEPNYFHMLLTGVPRILLAPIEPWRTHFVEVHRQQI